MKCMQGFGTDSWRRRKTRRKNTIQSALHTVSLNKRNLSVHLRDKRMDPKATVESVQWIRIMKISPVTWQTLTNVTELARCCEMSLKLWVAEILLAPEGFCSVKLVHMYLLEKPALINKLQESRSLDFYLPWKLIKLAAKLSLSLFSCMPVRADGIFTSSVTNTHGKVHSSGVSNFLMHFMRISTPLRPIIAETNQFLRFLGLIHLALNEIKSSNSECTACVSIPRPTRLRYAARGHIFQLQWYLG